MSEDDLQEAVGLTQPAVWDSLRGQRIFLTGGTGFVGRWLLELLRHADAAHGLELAVCVLSRSPARFAATSPHLARWSGLKCVTGDVCDFAFPAEPCDFVIHAALPVVDAAQLGDELVAVARTGTRRVCEFAEAAGVRRFLHVSSGAVYDSGAVDRNALLPWSDAEAANPYTRAKRAAETIVRERWVFERVIARCFAFIGPGLQPSSGSAAAQFIAQAASGKPVSMRGDGKAVRTYQYASEMARWLLTMLTNAQDGAAFDVGSDDATDIASLARRVTGLAGAVYVPPDQGQAVPSLAGNHYVPDVTPAAAQLGLFNRVPLDEAILRTLRWQRLPTALHAARPPQTTTATEPSA